MDFYTSCSWLGEGTFGVVMKAKEIESGEFVALKKVRLRSVEEGIPTATLREIKSLEMLDHPNIINLRNVFAHGVGIVLVFDFMVTDLSKLLKTLNGGLSESEIKCLMQMLLEGLAECHRMRIIHRDIKPANLLLGANGVLKLADFGLARVHTNKGDLYSHQVATRWYRAPELLFGAKEYDYSVDMWGVGCIFGELLNNAPMFTGENDIDQLYIVLKTLGSPDEESWVGLTELADYQKITFPHFDAIPWQDLFPDASPEAVELISKMLVMNPGERISAEEALLDEWFLSEPLPCHPSELPLKVSAKGKGEQDWDVKQDKVEQTPKDEDHEAWNTDQIQQETVQQLKQGFDVELEFDFGI